VFRIIFEIIKNNTEHIYKETLIFLKIKDIKFQPEFKNHLPNRILSNSLSYQLFHLLRTPPSWMFKIGNVITPPFLKSLRRKFIWNLLRRLKKLVAPQKNRPELNSYFHQRLKQKFVLEVQELSELVNRNLIDTWKYK
jgi:hypothetical protein